MAKFVVFGGTGVQGGGVVQSLMERGGYNIVVPTRNPDSEKAVALNAKGVETVKCDQHSEEDVQTVIKDAEYVFAVTNFWDPQSMGKEVELGKRMADAAKAAGVKLFFWSSLPNADEISKGKYHVPHLTDKALVADYCKSIDLPSVFVEAAFYFSNFQYFFPPQETEDGLVFNIPMPGDKPLAAFDAKDMGKAVVMVLQDEAKYRYKSVPVFAENRPLAEYIEEYGTVTGKKATLNSMAPEDFKKLGFPGADELAEMFQFFTEFGVFADQDLSLSPKGMTTFNEWAKAALGSS
eukprot:m.351721 g.351721  ORF g.351721 m.351721 type:complete len:293 (+) comp16328_c0_seq1:125-1003(+)